MKKSKKPTIEEEIKTILTDLLAKLKVEAQIEVTKNTSEEDKSDYYLIDIKTAETGLLIGYHGETINSLQLLLGVILYKKLGEWYRVVLDVGGYRKAREDSIREMVNRIVSEVETTKQPVTLPYLTPLERRTVHMLLADSQTVVSESSGSGRERRLTIKPRE